MSTANEQPGPGLPEEPVEPAELADLADVAELAALGGDLGVADAAGGADPADAANAPEPGAGGDAEPASRAAETEEERVAREAAEFDKLVAAFHGESAPDPQPHLPSPGSAADDGPGAARPRKIIRYPVLDPRREWGDIVEPTDETTVDPLDYVEHYEQPDPELPQASAATLASWTMLIGGVAFLVLHALLQWDTPDYLGWLAIIGVFGGIVSLVARMKPDRDEYDDPDNGAVV